MLGDQGWMSSRQVVLPASDNALFERFGVPTQQCDAGADLIRVAKMKPADIVVLHRLHRRLPAV